MTRTPPCKSPWISVFKAHASKPHQPRPFDGVHARDYGAIPDILMVDSYPILVFGPFSQHMTWARYQAPQSPLRGAQAFDWYAFRDAVPGETRFRVPTHEELKYDLPALAQPVDGLLFYTFASGKWFLPDHPDLWHGLLDIVQSLHQHSYLWAASGCLGSHPIRSHPMKNVGVRLRSPAFISLISGMPMARSISCSSTPPNILSRFPFPFHPPASAGSWQEAHQKRPLGAFVLDPFMKSPLRNMKCESYKAFRWTKLAPGYFA